MTRWGPFESTSIYLVPDTLTFYINSNLSIILILTITFSEKYYYLHFITEAKDEMTHPRSHI